MAAKKKNIEYYQAVGRRKESTARVRLYIVSKRDKTVDVRGSAIKQGSIIINGKLADDYFPRSAEKTLLAKPFVLTENVDRFVVSILVKGGGKSGQLEATVHGIARALCLVDAKHRTTLRKEGLLTRDPRVRERRKVGMGGKARRKKQSPKR
ncbi:MAG: 30S ribosomal protein S9 [Candidatus Roizmanbacteria bacterium GW2011_GWA2_37_7]|uniref:30S ribosomal protein S9 n=1 Tax=Candidatus Roizmanbacteria bacterium GW2011_GWA2_37_7 TaxID=1618481 RepID=A0A0G0HID5_9BACT|nr:MAG: 30S ribosomal protein S9 [Candidatus Roizmanbacteria bacterium GW2011_GWA2_37_7]